MENSNNQNLEKSEVSENELQFFNLSPKSVKILLTIAIELLIIIILLIVAISIQHSLKEYLFYYLIMN